MNLAFGQLHAREISFLVAREAREVGFHAREASISGLRPDIEARDQLGRFNIRPDGPDIEARELVFFGFWSLVNTNIGLRPILDSLAFGQLETIPRFLVDFGQF